MFYQYVDLFLFDKFINYHYLGLFYKKNKIF